MNHAFNLNIIIVQEGLWLWLWGGLSLGFLKIIKKKKNQDHE